MKLYEKEINGKIVRKLLKNIIIEKDGMTTYNPTEEMILTDGWTEYVAPKPQEPTEEELLENAKQCLLNDINNYDNSDSVNNCIITFNGESINYWADKTERSSLKTAVQDCLAMGRTEYRLDLREAGIYVMIDCEKLLQMLSALEVYAIDCYNKTTDNIFAINALNSIEAIEEYDYHNGYPEQLTFEL